MKIRFKKLKNSYIKRNLSQHTKDSSISIRNFNNETEDLFLSRIKKSHKKKTQEKNSLLFQSNSSLEKINTKNLSSSCLIFNNDTSFIRNRRKNSIVSSINSLKNNNDSLIFKSKSNIDIKKRNSVPIEFLLEQSENKKVNKSKIKNSRKINYTLKELIKLDPYHVLNRGVKDDIKRYSIKNEIFKFPNIGKKSITSNGNYLRVLNCNSLLIKSNKEKTQLIKKLFKIKNESHCEFKYIVKWEGIYHLWQKHKVIINNLLVKFYEYKWFINKNEIMTFEELNEFLIFIFEISSVKISFSCFLEDLSYLFSEDRKKTNLKKLYTVFIITNNNISYIDKIDFLCNVWENKDSGEVNVRNLFYYIKNIFRKKGDYQKICQYFRKYQKINYNFTKDKIKNIFMNDKKVRFYFERNCQINYKIIDENFNDFISQIITHNVNYLGINYLNSKTLCSKEIENFEILLKKYDKNIEIKDKLKICLNK